MKRTMFSKNVRNNILSKMFLQLEKRIDKSNARVLYTIIHTKIWHQVWRHAQERVFIQTGP